MKTLITSAIVALALAGAAVTTAPAEARSSFGVYVGPGGAQIGYSQGSYYDRSHRRHYYRYPRDWAAYHHPRVWYRDHPNWYQERDWYRR